MFVFMAIVLTLLTTPLTLWCYPARARTTIHSLRRKSSHLNHPHHQSSINSSSPVGGEGSSFVNQGVGTRLSTLRFAVVLMRMEQVPAVMTLLKLFQPNLRPALTLDEKAGGLDAFEGRREEDKAICVDALRLVRLPFSARASHPLGRSGS